MLFIGGCLRALGVPKHFAQTLHDPVLDGMLVRRFIEQSPIAIAQPAGLIKRQLFFDGDMHPEVQERIAVARFREKVTVAHCLGIFQSRMVFGMSQEHRHDQLFRSFKPTPFTVRLPGAKKNLPRPFAIPSNKHLQGVLDWNRPSTAEYWKR